MNEADFPEVGCARCLSDDWLDFDFTMAFQPIVDLTTGEVFAHEALCRGLDGAGAGSILARVNETNRYRFDQTCRVKAVQLAASLGMQQHLSINFMPDAIYRPERCIRTTLEAARQFGFPHQKIIFEVTEDQPVRDKARLSEIFRAYRALGFKTAIDDFGAGFAGLNLLADFDPDIIKIDMALTRGIDRDAKRRLIVRSILLTCKELGIQTVAEGIETEDELRAVRDLGVDLVQGYILARPAFEALAELLPDGVEALARLRSDGAPTGAA